MRKIEEFRKKYPNGKIDVVCENKEATTYIKVRAYAKFDDDEMHYLAQCQSICFSATDEKLSDAVAKAVSDCMMYAGVFVNDTTPASADNEVEAGAEKPRRGRKPKAAKDEEGKDAAKDKRTEPMTEDEKVAMLEELDNLSLEFPEAVKQEEIKPVAEPSMDTAEYDVDSDVVVIRTMEQAKAYKVPSGRYKDMFIGELMAVDKNAVEYFATKYKGTDVNVRVAAKIALGIEKTVDF